MPSAKTPSPERSIWAGAVIGVGAAVFIDDTVFHRLLHWHHLYDRSTPAVGLVSDGLLQMVGWLATVIGLIMVIDLVRRSELRGRALAGGIFLGIGGYTLYDGTVQHKILRLHQIRYDVDIAPYDWAWNIIGVIMLLVGACVLRAVLRRGERRR